MKTEVSKIYFLVHPGWDSDCMERGLYSEDYSPEEFAKDVSLLGLYLDHVREMQPDEIMFALLHTSFKQLREDMISGRLYARKLRDLKQTLGGRLVVLSEDRTIEEKGKDMFGPKTLQLFRKISEDRGYFYTNDVAIEVMGETSGVCVMGSAINITQYGGFYNPTIIRLELTDAINQSPETMERLKTDPYLLINEIVDNSIPGEERRVLGRIKFAQ